MFGASMRTLGTGCGLAILLLPAMLRAQVPQRYTISEIIVGTEGTTIGRVNNSGALAGRARFAGGATRAFLYEAGTVTLLDSLGDGTADAAGIVNNLGRILGNSHN